MLALHHFVPLQTMLMASYARLFAICVHLAPGLGLNVSELLRPQAAAAVAKGVGSGGAEEVLASIAAGSELDLGQSVPMRSGEMGQGLEVGVGGAGAGAGVGGAGVAGGAGGVAGDVGEKIDRASFTAITTTASETTKMAMDVDESGPAEIDLGSDDQESGGKLGSDEKRSDTSPPRAAQAASDSESDLSVLKKTASDKTEKSDKLDTKEKEKLKEKRKEKKSRSDMDDIFAPIKKKKRPPPVLDPSPVSDSKRSHSTNADSELKPKKKKIKDGEMDDIFSSTKVKAKAKNVDAVDDISASVPSSKILAEPKLKKKAKLDGKSKKKKKKDAMDDIFGF